MFLSLNKTKELFLILREFHCVFTYICENCGKKHTADDNIFIKMHSHSELRSYNEAKTKIFICTFLSCYISDSQYMLCLRNTMEHHVYMASVIKTAVSEFAPIKATWYWNITKNIKMN